MTRPTCPCCKADAMLQRSGRKRRVNCVNYDLCGMQTPWLALKTTAATEAECWRRWERRAG